MAVTTTPRNTLAESLLKDGLISRDQYESAVKEYEKTKQSIIRILSDMGALDDQSRMAVLHRTFGHEVVKLKDVVPSVEVAGLIPKDMCRRHHLVPLRMDQERVVIAMEDPSDVRVIGDIEKVFGRSAKVVLASSKEIGETIDRMPQFETANSGAPMEVGVDKVVGSMSLLVLTLVPLAASYYYCFYHATGSEWYASFELDHFETGLAMVIAWGCWAAIAYFVNDLIFGKQNR